MRLISSPFVLLLACIFLYQDTPTNGTFRVIELLSAARKRAQLTPVLSPRDSMVVGTNPSIDIKAVRRAGFPVVVWTVNDPSRMHALLLLGVDGIISDRPDLLQTEVQRSAAKIDVQGHRGGRDLRPENTLPAFESGLDNLITTIETDTGVTRDRVSLISHEQFLNPQTCRAADGSTYTESNEIWIHNITMADAAKRFICDKLIRGQEQRNDLTLSPVAVAFAGREKLASPYSPTNVAQLFEFVSFYSAYYRSGPGHANPDAKKRAANADRVRFNLETKTTPKSEQIGHTFDARTFTQTLGGVIRTHNMESRTDIQSFDFRTLALVEKAFPKIRTAYLLESLTALDQ